MKREIKYRGLLKEGNTWVYGHYYETPAPLQCIGPKGEPECNIVFENPNCISDWNMPRQMVRGVVERETVGQYTGIKDISGYEIYEGNIVYQYDVLIGTKHVNITGIVKLIDGSWIIDDGKQCEYLFKECCENKIMVEIEQ